MKKMILPILFLYSSLFASWPGSLDASFGKDGIVTTLVEEYCSGASIALQSNGKLFVTGSTKVQDVQECITIAYNTDGTIDTSFGKGGVVTAQLGDAATAEAILVQPDDKLVVIGTGNFEHDKMAVLRYNPDGTLDRTFAHCGITVLDHYIGQARAGVLQPDNKIVIAGTVKKNGVEHAALARFNEHGDLDKTFGFEGVVTTTGKESSCFGVALQKDGKLVITGQMDNDLLVGRFNANGTPDDSFCGDGFETTHFSETSVGRSVAIQEDGKIVVAGFASIVNLTSCEVARYCSDGALDPAFGLDGVVNIDLDLYTKWYSLVIQPDQKIVLAGMAVINDEPHVMVARINPKDGSLDTGFDCNGVVMTKIGSSAKGCALALDHDGNIIVAGKALIVENHVALSRYIGREKNCICALCRPIMCAICKKGTIFCSLLKRLFSLC